MNTFDIIDIVGLTAWGKYVTAQTFSSISETFLSIGIPYVIIKFIPSFVENEKEKASRIANVFLKYAFVVRCIDVIKYCKIKKILIVVSSTLILLCLVIMINFAVKDRAFWPF